MSTKIIKGIAGIDLAPIPVDGGIAADADFVSVGPTFRDEAKLTEADATEVDHYSNESDDPEECDVVGGKKQVIFTLTNYEPINIQKYLGGTVTGIAPNDKWQAPRVKQAYERELRFRSKNGKYMTFPRVAVFATMDGDFTPKGIEKIKVKATIMTPEKAGVGPIEKGTLVVV